MWGPLIAALMLATHPPERCTLRIATNAIYVDGDPMSRADAIRLCKRSHEAIVVIEDKIQGAAVRAELEAAHIKVLLRGVIDDGNGRACMENPLAKGCN